VKLPQKKSALKQTLGMEKNFSLKCQNLAKLVTQCESLLCP